MKHIAQGNQESSTAVLEERVHDLERRVTALADVVRVLVRGLEDLPTAEPGQRPAAEAARRAHDLLLVAEPQTSGPQADEGGRDG